MARPYDCGEEPQHAQDPFVLSGTSSSRPDPHLRDVLRGRWRADLSGKSQRSRGRLSWALRPQKSVLLCSTVIERPTHCPSAAPSKSHFGAGPSSPTQVVRPPRRPASAMAELLLGSESPVGSSVIVAPNGDSRSPVSIATAPAAGSTALRGQGRQRMANVPAVPVHSSISALSSSGDPSDPPNSRPWLARILSSIS